MRAFQSWMSCLAVRLSRGWRRWPRGIGFRLALLAVLRCSLPAMGADEPDIPRIFVAIQDIIKDSPSARPKTNSQLSFLSITEYLQSRKDKFDCRDLSLNLLQGNTGDSLDTVALEQASQGNYDILVSGTTTSTRETIVLPPGLKLSPYRFLTTINWKVTAVATRTPLFPLEDVVTDVEDPITKYRDLFPREKVKTLFGDLMDRWNRTHSPQRYQIAFYFSASEDSAILLSDLMKVRGLESEKPSMTGEDKGRITFDVSVSRELAPICSSLGKVFLGRYRLLKPLKPQSGRIELQR